MSRAGVAQIVGRAQYCFICTANMFWWYIISAMNHISKVISVKPVQSITQSPTLLKSSQNKKDLNDVTAVPFSVFFCCWQF